MVFMFIKIGSMSQRSSVLALMAALCISALLAQQPVPTHAPPFPQAQQPSTSAPAQAFASKQQGQNQSADQNAPTLHIGINEVNLIFTVTDKHAHYVPNLKLSDFALLDDQKGPEKVTSFRQQINLPLRVGIIIDASASIRTRFQFEQQSALEFLLQIMKSRRDRAFVMGFDVTPSVTADWTNNIDSLEAGKPP